LGSIEDMKRRLTGVIAKLDSVEVLIRKVLIPPAAFLEDLQFR
jgi:hypothetical protein